MTIEEFDSIKIGDHITRIESNGPANYKVVGRDSDNITIQPTDDVPAWRRKEQQAHRLTARDIIAQSTDGD